MNRHDLRLRLRALLFRRQAEAELEEEISAHLEMQVRKYVQRGMSLEEANQRANLDFGGREKAKEECRDSRRISLVSGVPGSTHGSDGGVTARMRKAGCCADRGARRGYCNFAMMASTSGSPAEK